jgi:small multidrug resistance pump
MTPVAPALAMVLISALGYAGATLVMARMGAGHAPILFTLVGAAMGLAVLAEIAALRHLPIGVVYLSILGLEALLILAAATCLGHRPGLTEIVGASLVLAGTAMLATSHG